MSGREVLGLVVLILLSGGIGTLGAVVYCEHRYYSRLRVLECRANWIEPRIRAVAREIALLRRFSVTGQPLEPLEATLSELLSVEWFNASMGFDSSRDGQK